MRGKSSSIRILNTIKDKLKSLFDNFVNKNLILKIVIAIFFISFILYESLSFTILKFTEEIYLLNWQFVPDAFAISLAFYSLYLRKKLVDIFILGVKESSLFSDNNNGVKEKIMEKFRCIFKNILKQEQSLNKCKKDPKEPNSDKKRINEENIKKWNFIWSLICSIAAFMIPFLFLGIFTGFQSIIWGKTTLYYYNIEEKVSVFFYAIFISIIISWLTYFGIYNVRQYHTISIFISHLSSDKEFSIKLNFKSFKSKGIPFIMENYAKISIRVFIPASILLGIGFMYLFAFNYILAGIFYALIGGIVMVRNMLQFSYTRKTIIKDIEKFKRNLRDEIFDKIESIKISEAKLEADKIQKIYYLNERINF